MHKQPALCTQTTGKHISFSRFLQIKNRFFNFIILRIMDYSVLFRLSVTTGEV